MAAEFDTEPNHIDEDDRPAEPARQEPRDTRGLWGTVAILVLIVLVLLLLLTQCTARVPNVVGLSERDAKATLTKADFEVGEVSELPLGSGKPGVVHEQAPAAGTIVRKSTSVDLMIPLGANLTLVPNVVGLQAAEASVKVLQAGFEVASGQEYSDFVPVGVAVSQTPAAGTRAEKGSTVTAYYSLGPQSEADFNVSPTDTDDGLSDAERDSTGSGTDQLIMNCVRAYPGATAWSSGGDIYVRLSPGGGARRVTSTGDWDTNPVISPSHKYLVFTRASSSGSRPTRIGAVCFTDFSTHMISLPSVNFVDSKPHYVGKPIFAPSAGSTQANSDWIVFPQYWSRQYWGGTKMEYARMIVCNVPMGSSWVSWNERFHPARTLSLKPSSRAGCIRITQKNGSKTLYSRDFNVTTGLYLR